MSRLVGIVCLVILGFLLASGLAFAIGNPDYVLIADVYVFRDVLELGDQLYFTRYDVSYATNQTEDAKDTWQMALYDSSGALIATRPLNYYQHNIISIYLTPVQAINVTWGGAHSVKIRGAPSVFGLLIEGTNMVTKVLAAGDYFEKSSLQGILIDQAKELEDDWDTVLLTPGNKLNTTGSTFFAKAIPNLGSMVPGLLATAVRQLPPEYTSWNQTYVAELQEHEGSRLRGAVTEIGSYFGLSEGWSGFWLISMVYLLFVGAMYPAVRNPGWALIAGFPVLVGAAFLGIGTSLLTLVVVLVLVAALIFGVYFILGRL